METTRTELVVRSGRAELKAFLARPAAAGTHPGVVVIHEIFGLTDHIRDVARRLASEGYAALALDLFSEGKALCILKTFAAMAGGTTDHFGTRHLKSGLDFLARQPFVDPQRLGAIGFCMGGNFAIALAYEDKRVKVIAPFYGLTPRRIKDFNGFCPVAASFPEQDFTAKQAPKLEAALAAAGVPHDVKTYPGAKHSYMNERSAKSYHREAAKDSWKRTLTFFARYLRAPEPS